MSRWSQPLRQDLAQFFESGDELLRFLRCSTLFELVPRVPQGDSTEFFAHELVEHCIRHGLEKSLVDELGLLLDRVHPRAKRRLDLIERLQHAMSDVARDWGRAELARGGEVISDRPEFVEKRDKGGMTR